MGAAGLLLMSGVVYGVIRYEFSREKPALIEGFNNLIDSPANRQIPPDARALLRQVSEVAAVPECTIGATVLLVKIGENALADHQISEAEKKNLTLGLNFVGTKQGAVSYLELGDFYTAHPEIGAIVNDRAAVAPPVKTTAATSQTQAR